MLVVQEANFFGWYSYSQPQDGSVLSHLTLFHFLFLFSLFTTHTNFRGKSEGKTPSGRRELCGMWERVELYRKTDGKVSITAWNRTTFKFRIFWDVAPCSHVGVDLRFRGKYCLHHQAIIALMMEAVRTSETSVNFSVTTRRYIPKTLNFILAVVRTWNLTFNLDIIG
jgi:hypothetical protein